MKEFTIELRERKWRVVNSVGQTVVTVEPPAGVNVGERKALATHLASLMNQILQWS